MSTESYHIDGTTSTLPAAVNIGILKPLIRELYRALCNLCKRLGYAYIHNKSLATEYGVSVATAERWISKLRALGLIRTEFCHKTHQRKIYCIVALSELRPVKQTPPATEVPRKNEGQYPANSQAPSRAPVILNNLPETQPQHPDATSAPLPLPDPAAQTAPNDVVVSASVSEPMQAAEETNLTVAKPYRTCVQTPVELSGNSGELPKRCRTVVEQRGATSEHLPSGPEQIGQPEIVSAGSTLFSNGIQSEPRPIPAAKPRAADNAPPNAPDSLPTPVQAAIDALQAAGLAPKIADKFTKLRGVQRCLEILNGCRRRKPDSLPKLLFRALEGDYVPDVPATALSTTQGASTSVPRREIVPTGFRTAVEVHPPDAVGLAALRAARVKVRQANRA